MSSKLQDHKQLAATTIRPEQIIAPDLLLLLSGAFFTGSNQRVRHPALYFCAEPLILWSRMLNSFVDPGSAKIGPP